MIPHTFWLAFAGLLAGLALTRLHVHLNRRAQARVLAVVALHLADRHVERLVGWALQEPTLAAEWLAARRQKRLARVTWTPKAPRDEADPALPEDVEQEIMQLVEAAWGDKS